MAEVIARLLDNLSIQKDKIEVLTDLKAALGNITIPTLSSVVSNFSFNSVFDCLVTENREQFELTCDVLRKLLAALPPQVSLTQFQEELTTGLRHQEPAVRKLCLSEMLRATKDAGIDMRHNEDLMVCVVKALADECLEVAKIAGDVLVSIGGSILYGEAILSALQDILSSNDTIRFRTYEVLVSISKLSVAGLQMMSDSGLLQQFINELHKDDILVQLNCLELLSDLALTEHGLVYLEQKGIITTLEHMMHSTQSDPLAAFIIPGLVKFFGCVARLHPKEMCSNNHVFVSTVFNNLSSPESESMLRLSIQTVGFIGSSVEGKLALEKLGNKMDTGVRCMGKIVRDSQQDTKIITLQALAALLKLKVPDQTSELLKLTEHWYNQCGTQTFGYLMSLVELPFPELRCALLLLLESLAAQAWSQMQMNNHPGFREYLLDRSTEKTKEGKDGKFEIVSTLANSPTALEIFGQPYMIHLKVYCSQGPYFVRVQAEVALEDS